MSSSQAATHIADKIRLEPGKPVILRTALTAHYRDMMTVYDSLRRLHWEKDLPAPLDIAIPTEREIAQLWP